MKNRYYVYDDFRLIGEALTLDSALALSGLPYTSGTARVNMSKGDGLLNKDNIYIFRIKDREARVRWLADMVAKRAHTHPDLLTMERLLREIVSNMLGREI